MTMDMSSIDRFADKAIADMLATGRPKKRRSSKERPIVIKGNVIIKVVMQAPRRR